MLPLAVVNGDGKTVVRAVIERAEAVDGSLHVVLPRRLTGGLALGYDSDLEPRCGVRERLGLEPAGALAVFDEAVVATGGPLGAVSSSREGRARSGMRADAPAAEVPTQLAAYRRGDVWALIADLDTELLHDFRVALRRARAALREPSARRPGRSPTCPPSPPLSRPRPARCATSTSQLLGWEELISPARERARGGPPAAAGKLVERRPARQVACCGGSLRGAPFAAALPARRALAQRRHPPSRGCAT